jgi:hypothetical protein
MAPSTRSFSGAALSVTGELDEGESEISNRSQDALIHPLAVHEDFLMSRQVKHDAFLIVDTVLGIMQLIKEGQRALEYNVHVQDVELGGRVLAPEELGEIGLKRPRPLSPISPNSSGARTRPPSSTS